MFIWVELIRVFFLCNLLFLILLRLLLPQCLFFDLTEQLFSKFIYVCFLLNFLKVLSLNTADLLPAEPFSGSIQGMVKNKVLNFNKLSARADL